MRTYDCKILQIPGERDARGEREREEDVGGNEDIFLKNTYGFLKQFTLIYSISSILDLKLYCR